MGSNAYIGFGSQNRAILVMKIILFWKQQIKFCTVFCGSYAADHCCRPVGRAKHQKWTGANQLEVFSFEICSFKLWKSRWWKKSSVTRKLSWFLLKYLTFRLVCAGYEGIQCLQAEFTNDCSGKIVLQVLLIRVCASESVCLYRCYFSMFTDLS